jgi:PAS domain S-box-containing protein
MPVDLQALYPKLIQLMLETVFVVDENSQIVFVSDACEALLGYRADELIGTSIIDYVHPDDLAITGASITRVMEGRPHVDFRNRYIRKDGGIAFILWSARWSVEGRCANRCRMGRDSAHRSGGGITFPGPP